MTFLSGKVRNQIIDTGQFPGSVARFYGSSCVLWGFVKTTEQQCEGSQSSDELLVNPSHVDERATRRRTRIACRAALARSVTPRATAARYSRSSPLSRR